MRLDCGHLALVELAAHHGIRTTREHLLRLAPPDAAGVSLATLAEAARGIGLDAQMVAGAPLEGLPFPAVLHVDGDHWLCARKPTPDLAARFTGHALIAFGVSPSGSSPPGTRARRAVLESGLAPPTRRPARGRSSLGRGRPLEGGGGAAEQRLDLSWGRLGARKAFRTFPHAPRGRG